ncbi:MAG: uroporphyrinogen decarboxylase family protein [Opitutaceae bacterium]
MARSAYLDLAAAGLRMPIGVHLVLHGHADPDAILLDGARLGAVIAETARRFSTPLAMPLMDLTLEKAALLLACGVPAAEVDSHHFTTAPEPPDRLPLTPRMDASCAAIARVSIQPGLIPMGMSIGPFSLMTKLVADPITPVFLAGSGLTAAEDAEVDLVERMLALGERIIHRYLHAQIDAGARAIIVCEPAANLVYFSPLQLQVNPELFERFVMAPMQRISRLLADRGVDLVFHDCGELTDDMIRRFDTLGSVMLSLGSSRQLWRDAALVSKQTVLFGNLPTKRFCSGELTVAEVARLSGELIEKMQAAGHPFILGSECDVLSVPGREREILGKVDALMGCSCPAGSDCAHSAGSAA